MSSSAPGPRNRETKIAPTQSRRSEGVPRHSIASAAHVNAAQFSDAAGAAFAPIMHCRRHPKRLKT